MNATAGTRRIIWSHVLTVLSAAVLIGTEVFGAAFAGGWAFANRFGLGQVGAYAIQAVLTLLGLFVMAAFVRGAQRIEPFVARD
jgi:hypothetical protein